jgi:hypothetical protein
MNLPASFQATSFTRAARLKQLATKLDIDTDGAASRLNPQSSLGTRCKWRINLTGSAANPQATS